MTIKRVAIGAFLLLLILPNIFLGGDETKKRIAVFDFSVASGLFSNKDYGKGAADRCLPPLVNSSYFIVLDRAAISKKQESLEEKIAKKLVESIDDTDYAKIAKSMKADYMLLGRVAKATVRYDTTMRLVNVNTGIVVWAESAKAMSKGGVEDDAEKLTKMLVKKLEKGELSL